MPGPDYLKVGLKSPIGCCKLWAQTSSCSPNFLTGGSAITFTFFTWETVMRSKIGCWVSAHWQRSCFRHIEVDCLRPNWSECSRLLLHCRVKSWVDYCTVNKRREVRSYKASTQQTVTGMDRQRLGWVVDSKMRNGISVAFKGPYRDFGWERITNRNPMAAL